MKYDLKCVCCKRNFRKMNKLITHYIFVHFRFLFKLKTTESTPIIEVKNQRNLTAVGKNCSENFVLPRRGKGMSEISIIWIMMILAQNIEGGSETYKCTSNSDKSTGFRFSRSEMRYSRSYHNAWNNHVISADNMLNPSTNESADLPWVVGKMRQLLDEFIVSDDENFSICGMHI